MKDTKALLDVSDLGIGAGADLYAVDANGKKRALLHVKQVKNGKAVAEITKGKAQVGQSLQVKGGGGAPADASSSTEASGGSSGATQADRTKRPKGFLGQFFNRGTGVGAMVGMSQNKMALTAKATSGNSTISEDIAMAGSSYNVVGFYDYDFGPNFTVRGAAGLETFSVSGTSQAAVCNGGTSCSVGFNYLALEGHAHYNLMNKHTRVWIGAGFDFLLAMSKSTTVTNLDTSSATNQMLEAEVGGDISLGDGTFVPISLEYGMFPGSSSVTASSILARIGYGWRF